MSKAQILDEAAYQGFGDDPKPNPSFLALDNVLLQPCQASSSVEIRKALRQLLGDNLTAHFARQPLLTPVL
jgi:lactate dehydrogenase-like 2-hydroxyacid dehydrogenase